MIRRKKYIIIDEFHNVIKTFNSRKTMYKYLYSTCSENNGRWIEYETGLELFIVEW